jgi:hypothetical protein
MSVEDFYDLLPSTVVLEPCIGHGTYGEELYGTPVEGLRARVSYSQKLVPLPGGTGEQVVSRGTVWVAYTGEVKANDRLTLPDGSTPEILLVDQPGDETGIRHHTKITFR